MATGCKSEARSTHASQEHAEDGPASEQKRCLAMEHVVTSASSPLVSITLAQAQMQVFPGGLTMKNIRLLARLLSAFAVAVLVLYASANAQTFQVLHAFAAPPTDGFPSGAFLLDSQGHLFFASDAGGENTDCSGYGCGAVFELSKGYGHWKESTLYAFSPFNGNSPTPAGPLIMDTSGNIYGTQSHGGDPSCDCGAVYQLTQSAGVWSQNLLYSFTGGVNDGMYPASGLVRDSAGNLYGSTSNGGLNNNGTIFELSPNADGTWSYSIIHNFSYGVNGSSDGSEPYGPLTMDSLGNLYGTTLQGGLWSYGTAFRLSFSSGTSTEAILFNFTLDYSFAPNPVGVVPDAAGNLYGTTQSGGAYGLGTIYKLTPAIGFWNRTILHTFTGSGDGANPLGGLAIDATGALYGASIQGGSFGYGNVYKFSHVSGRWNQTLLHEFTNGTDGREPVLGLVLDWKGNVYGLANGGGAYGNGVAFEIMP